MGVRCDNKNVAKQPERRQKRAATLTNADLHWSARCHLLRTHTGRDSSVLLGLDRRSVCGGGALVQRSEATRNPSLISDCTLVRLISGEKRTLCGVHRAKHYLRLYTRSYLSIVLTGHIGHAGSHHQQQQHTNLQHAQQIITSVASSHATVGYYPLAPGKYQVAVCE